MKAILTFPAVFILLAPYQKLQAASAPITDSAAIIEQAEGWIIVTSRGEGRLDYAVVLKVSGLGASITETKVLPAILDTPLPPGSLGESCWITGTIESTPIDNARLQNQKHIRITKIEPQKWI